MDEGRTIFFHSIYSTANTEISRCFHNTSYFYIYSTASVLEDIQNQSVLLPDVCKAVAAP